jgi:hypothetical protein
MKERDGRKRPNFQVIQGGFVDATELKVLQAGPSLLKAN